MSASKNEEDGAKLVHDATNSELLPPLNPSDRTSQAAGLYRESTWTIETLNQIPNLDELQQEYTSLRLAHTLVSAIVEFAETLNSIRKKDSTHAAQPAYVQQSKSVRSAMQKLRVETAANVERGRFDKDADDSFQRILRSLAESAEEYAKHFISNLMFDPGAATAYALQIARDRLLDAAETAIVALDREGLERARSVHEQAVRVLDATRQAAGEVGSLSLGGHFERYADRERRAADNLRIASLSVVLISTAIAAIIIFERGAADAASAADWLHLALVIPLAALAGYLGREASRHRRISNWAAQREVQLKTLEAYAAPMSERDREKLRADLGRRIFGVDLPDSLENSDSPSITTEASRLLPGRKGAPASESNKPAEIEARNQHVRASDGAVAEDDA